jgi:hypothetical protein
MIVVPRNLGKVERILQRSRLLVVRWKKLFGLPFSLLFSFHGEPALGGCPRIVIFVQIKAFSGNQAQPYS